jgi:lysophospholipase L1-like esterase
MSFSPRCLFASIFLLALGYGASAQPAGPNASDEPSPVAPAPNALEIVPAPAAGVAIDWQVLNRFRLFREEADFRLHVEAARGRTTLEAERVLEEGAEGRGWARAMVDRLCVDGLGRIAEECLRDGVQENYLAPADHRVEVRLSGEVPADATCAWRLAAAADRLPLTASAACAESKTFRVRYGVPTETVVDIAGPDGVVRRAHTTIVVRDLLIAGLGDSIASGDGNPDRPVALSDLGFCFHRFLGGGGSGEYYRPGRAGFRGDKSCDGGGFSDYDRAEWAGLSARWMDGACHRSLYGYQLRAALALAIETPHAAVTFLPLGCTGATINDGLFNGRRSRELNCAGTPCPMTTPAQLTELQALLARARRIHPDRRLDLVFLTIGANDIGFSGLIADVMVQPSTERTLFSRFGLITSAEAAEALVEKRLSADFARLRGALKPLLADTLERVVFVSYGNPALNTNGEPCPGGRAGFDVHPAFGADGERLAHMMRFVQDKFFPALKQLATCEARGGCANRADSMTFVDAHQRAFAQHGYCARAETDPPFDRDCFLADGKSFSDSLVTGATEPLACGLAVAGFRPFASRARWIRTPNDSYFTAMTFPEGVSGGLDPSDLHDATWGVLSAVYGGAFHPTAEGHAALADAAVAAAKTVLRLPEVDASIVTAPLPPLPGDPAGLPVLRN